MSRNLWWGIVAGVVAVAVAVGLLLLVRDEAPVLPDEVGGLVAGDVPAAFPDPDADPVDGIIEQRLDQYAYNDDKVSEAVGGAAVSTRFYVDPDDLEGQQMSVIAVAADAGPLVPDRGFADPEIVGYALPQTEWSRHGDVECLGTRIQPPRADSDYDEEDAAIDVATCQRRSGSLTVRVASGVDTSLDDVVAFTEALWDEVD